ncbi:hypothetical protein CDAR_119051 [Caerostris darwini]|uniref:Uncharacterized protein n=1 Tax=Caerostris darwini TaxID=1538125 RepID=A0AAV4VAC1_9ARAC|nr:hypothetical protein CDAR_119051 [Caerostris darwini]
MSSRILPPLVLECSITRDPFHSPSLIASPRATAITGIALFRRNCVLRKLEFHVLKWNRGGRSLPPLLIKQKFSFRSISALLTLFSADDSGVNFKEGAGVGKKRYMERLR